MTTTLTLNGYKKKNPSNNHILNRNSVDILGIAFGQESYARVIHLFRFYANAENFEKDGFTPKDKSNAARSFRNLEKFIKEIDGTNLRYEFGEDGALKDIIAEL